MSWQPGAQQGFGGEPGLPDSSEAQENNQAGRQAAGFYR